MIVVLFLVGLVFLISGAEGLVRGSSRLALAAGISPLVVGLTVVAFGTSSPEMAVSVQSALAGSSEIAVGNVVGSNIFNVLLILGLAAAVTPLAVAHQVVRLEVPLMIAASFLMLGMAYDGQIGRLDGLLLFSGAVAYTSFTVRRSRAETADRSVLEAPIPVSAKEVLSQLVWILAGLALLVIGSRWLVQGAAEFARLLGVSELVIGLTVIAAGTSLPEVATSIVASLRGERDIAVGNAVGSNLFNILFVLGTAAVVAPEGVIVPPAVLSFDLPVLVAVAVACLPIFFTGNVIARWEGLLFLGYYVAYTAYLILRAAEHDALPVFSQVMWLFVLPLTVLTLAVLAVRAYREQSRASR